MSVTCSGRLAPMIAAATFCSCSTQATASAAIDRPRSAAMGCSSCTRSRTSSFIHREMKVAPPPFSSVAREPSGAGWPGRYLPVRTPCAIGEKTIWLMPSSREAGMTSASGTR